MYRNEGDMTTEAMTVDRHLKSIERRACTKT